MSDLRAALTVNAKLHKEQVHEHRGAEDRFCAYCLESWPCPTRRLADEGLGGETNG